MEKLDCTVELMSKAELYGMLEKMAEQNSKNSRSKYRPGEKITSLDEMAQQEFIYHIEKVYHAGWFLSWQIKTAEHAIRAGTIKKAIRLTNEEYYKPEADAAYKKWLSEEVK